jgi:hypothetical protein
VSVWNSHELREVPCSELREVIFKSSQQWLRYRDDFPGCTTAQLAMIVPSSLYASAFSAALPA